MKIAILLGRGVEGCGVTRFAIEFRNWLIDNDIECNIFASKDKKHSIKTLDKDINYFPIDTMQALKNKFSNDYDVVVYLSFPAIKRGYGTAHSNEYQENFFEHLVQGVNGPKKVVIQLDHKQASLSRNYKFWESMEFMDVIFTYSLRSVFGKKIIEKGINVPMKQLRNGFNFDALKPKWKATQIPKLTYFNRYASFKDPHRMIKLFPMLQKAEILTELLGMQRNIGCAKDFYMPNADIIQEMQITDGEYVTRYLNGKTCHVKMDMDLSKIWAFAGYEHNQGLDQLSHAMFGADFYHLPADAYGDNLEFAMCEIIGVGSIPVFDKHWADNCMHDMGFLFKDFKDFAIYSDRDNLQAGVDEMASLVKDSVARNKRRERCFEVAKAHCDSDIAFGKIIEQL